MSTEIRASSFDALDSQPSKDKPARSIVGSALRWPAAILALLTVACLLPFSGKAFHIDDPIFIWSAQQITKHPLDFYGFTATWWARATPMWQIQQNPPGAAYYMAVIGEIAGWSERGLHLGFMLPAIVVVLATYYLARRFTREPLVAALITLIAPGFLVSATGVMCDVAMLALWMLALAFWIKGLDEDCNPAYLAIAGVLVAASALTKYFGMSLIPLLFVYSRMRQRRLGGWVGYLAIPVFALGAFEIYTRHLYGYGLISLAAGSSSASGSHSRLIVVHQSYFPGAKTIFSRVLAGLCFAGACTLPALTFVPLLWSRRQILWGAVSSGLLALAFYLGWGYSHTMYANEAWLHDDLARVSVQLFFYVAGGVSILGLMMWDLRQHRDRTSVLLALWILGTMMFAIVVNWDVNARTLLPVIPAVGILIARRLDAIQITTRLRPVTIAVPLVISAGIALWVAAGDMAVASTARDAANYVREKTREDFRKPWFQGRWGFEYYMESFGAQPADPDGEGSKFGDLVVIPRYNTALFKFPLKTTRPEFADFKIHTWVTAMNPDAGAGFYFSGWGPVPYVFGPVPTQQYLMARVLQEK